MRRLTFAFIGIVTIAIFSFSVKKYINDKNTDTEKVTMHKERPQLKLRKMYQ